MRAAYLINSSPIGMHMASPFFFLCCFFFLCLISLSSSFRSINPMNEGFAISLIHRDSPQSPFYNHSMTLYDRTLAAVKRSISRLNPIHQSASSQSGPPDLSPKLMPDIAEYIVSYYIGTPPTKVYSFIDTGSNIIWTKGVPYFDPTQSFSYTDLECGSDSCTYLGPAKGCQRSGDQCNYRLRYDDGSMSLGILSRDKFTFETPVGGLVDVGFLDFGYSFLTSPHFTGKENGCLGLNSQKLSFVDQLGIKKFSHCMVIPDKIGSRSSTMYFGSRPGVSGEPTQILKNPFQDYYVNLEGISIGDQKVPLPPGVFNLTAKFDGGVIIDSGSSHTWLRKEAFEPFLRMMLQKVHFPLEKPPSEEFELCFKGKNDDLHSIPPATFHFMGVDLRLIPETTFQEVKGGLFCLAILRNPNNNVTTIGNFQMRDFWVEYDIENQVISFASAKCENSI